MTEVILYVYDVTNSGNDKTNNTIMQINKFFKDGIGLGGIFHSAVQVHFHFLIHSILGLFGLHLLPTGSILFYSRLGFQSDLRMRVRFVLPQVYGDEEWSFGFCEQGTGVFSCPSTQNPMYTYREAIKLGYTSLSISKVNLILRELSREWPGHSYYMLSKNCNHFCDHFCERLGVQKLPGNLTTHSFFFFSLCKMLWISMHFGLLLNCFSDIYIVNDCSSVNR